MSDQKEKYLNAEIILAAGFASGMILMKSYPLAGMISGLISGGLIVFIYFLLGIRLLLVSGTLNFQIILDVVNYFGTALALLLLVVSFLWFRKTIVPELSASGLLLLCMILNLSNRYIYEIHDENYLIKQIRLLILLALALIFIYQT